MVTSSHYQPIRLANLTSSDTSDSSALTKSTEAKLSTWQQPQSCCIAIRPAVALWLLSWSSSLCYIFKQKQMSPWPVHFKSGISFKFGVSQAFLKNIHLNKVTQTERYCRHLPKEWHGAARSSLARGYVWGLNMLETSLKYVEIP